MGNPLTERASPGELADRGQVIEKKGILSIFERLAEIVEADFEALAPQQVPQNWRQLPVGIKLRFHWADASQEHPAMSGAVTATVPMVCQRCLEPFELELHVPLELLFGGSQDAGTPDADYGMWELDEDKLRPLEVVEESLIMALPLAAVHDAKVGCKARLDSEQRDDSDTVRPFADLKSLMRKQD